MRRIELAASFRAAPSADVDRFSITALGFSEDPKSLKHLQWSGWTELALVVAAKAINVKPEYAKLADGNGRADVPSDAALLIDRPSGPHAGRAFAGGFLLP